MEELWEWLRRQRFPKKSTQMFISSGEIGSGWSTWLRLFPYKPPFLRHGGFLVQFRFKDGSPCSPLLRQFQDPFRRSQKAQSSCSSRDCSAPTTIFLVPSGPKTPQREWLISAQGPFWWDRSSDLFFPFPSQIWLVLPTIMKWLSW